MKYELETPLSKEIVKKLKAGDVVYITGTVYTARDAAHARLVKLIEEGKPLPFELDGATIYYTGPCPAPVGMPIGPCGPTTSYRMDPFTPTLLEHGLVGMIGKGVRNEEVRQSIMKNNGVYFAATGGAATLLSMCVKEAELIAFPDLGAEAIRRLKVERFPCIVINDTNGKNYYDINKNNK